MSELVVLNRRRTPQPIQAAHPARVLLISPRYSAPYFPIGLAYISSYIRKFGHEVVALNMNLYAPDEGYRRLADILDRSAIDVVGITGITVAFNEMSKIVPFIKARSSCPVVLGGGITSCESELVMETIRPDFMVVSEGELIFQQLLDVIMTQGDASQVEGIWHWSEGTPHYTGEGPSIDNLDDLPYPDLDLFGMGEEVANQPTRQISYHETRFQAGKTIPVTASRSCPFRCTFCYHAGMGKYRRHSMVNVVDHIEDCLKKFEATHVSIYDELFSANKKRIYEFCDLLEQRNLKISWYCQLRVDQLDQDLLHRMKESGCRHISFGFESGSDVVLKSMDKKIRAEQIANAVDLTRKAKIGIQANFLFGDPAETEATLQESLAFQRKHDLMFVDWSAVIPYPGTRLYDFALKKGLIKDRVAFIRSMCNISSYLWNDMINMTEMPDDVYHDWYVKLRELNDQNHRRRPAILKNGSVIDGLNSEITVECPHCSYSTTSVLTSPTWVPDTPINVNTAIGIQGFNIVCDCCNRKMHLAANRIPHVAEIYASFQRHISALRSAGTPVVMLPAMDRYFGVFSEDIDLSGLNITGVLDSRAGRIGTTFMNHRVHELTVDAVKAFSAETFVILPWAEFDRAGKVLADAGVRPARILSWNDHYVEKAGIGHEPPRATG